MVHCMFERRSANSQRRIGQSLTEYGLIGALVIGLSLLALQMLGKSLNLSVTNMVPDRVSLQPTQTAAPGSGPSQNPAALPGSPGVQSPDGMTLKLPNGRSLDLDIPADISKSIMTVGANGTTDMLASSLEALAQQLLASGEISESGSNALLNLANIAHRQAAIARLVEDVMSVGGSNTQGALVSTIQFEGKTYKLDELAGLIATGTANADGTYPYGPEIAKFWQAYQDLWPAGAMTNSTAAGIVDVYVHEIANLADSNRVVISKMTTGYGGTPETYRQTQAEYMQSIGYDNTATLLKNKTGAAITHNDSAKICTTGGNYDSGQQCH